jgi:hypothetical protein
VKPVGKTTEHNEKQDLSPYAQACHQFRSDVLRALKREGTPNTDFLEIDGKRNVGTHKLRPLAHMGETIIPEQQVPHDRPHLAENIPKEMRARELAQLERWWEQFQKTLKKITQEKVIH